jgi:hypothetical protein
MEVRRKYGDVFGFMSGRKIKRGRRGEERIELPNQVGVFFFILSIFFFKKITSLI